MNCIRVIGTFSFLILLNCAAANRQVPLGGFIHDPNFGIQGDLRIITLEPEKVEGEFIAATHNGRGVYFLSEVKEDSRSLLITTLEGEQLYRAVSPSNKDILVSLMENDFLLKNYKSTEGRAFLQGIMVPAGSVAAIERTLDEPDGIEERFYKDAETNSLSVMQLSFKKLRRRFEIACFVHATVKLGRDKGVLGSVYPAAMSLYVMAMRLSKHEGAALLLSYTVPTPTHAATSVPWVVTVLACAARAAPVGRGHAGTAAITRAATTMTSAARST